jgi:glutathione S-transferase
LHSRVLVIESMRTPHALVTDRGILTKSPAMLGLRRAKFPRDGPCAVAADGFAQIQEFNPYVCTTLRVANWRLTVGLQHRQRARAWGSRTFASGA